MVALPHDDTVEDCFSRVMVEQVEMVRVHMIDRLIRMKIMGKYRLLNTYYMIAADASGVLTFKERHCDHCLERKNNNDTITYYHPVLEMKLITENGFAFSIGSEFIENPTGYYIIMIDTSNLARTTYTITVTLNKDNYTEQKVDLLLVVKEKTIFGIPQSWFFII